MDVTLENIEELLKTVHEMYTEKANAARLDFKKAQDQLLSLYRVEEDKYREIQELWSAEHVDYELLQIKLDEVKLNKFKELSDECKSLYQESYVNLILARQEEMLAKLEAIDQISLNHQNAVLEFYEKIFEQQRNKVEKYQKGPKKKSSESQKNWELAQQYLAEEIPKHRTLQSARRAAAKRAGITVNERRLIQMLPVKK